MPGSYEIRHYGPAKWVSTSVESMDWDSAIQTGFTRLNSYIEGKNEKEMKIKMTAPVTSYVEPGSGPFSESTITISLYIPSEQQSDPPRPSESDVFIEDRAEMTVFVRPFLPLLSLQRRLIDSTPRGIAVDARTDSPSRHSRPALGDLFTALQLSVASDSQILSPTLISLLVGDGGGDSG
ncbi:heme-binding protein 2 [Camelus ferus]|nr:heme-binding protein 2 [Camelus ferus]